MRGFVLRLATLGLLAFVGSSEALELRFHPSQQVYAYELDAARGLRSVVLQNIAVINDGDTEVTISQVNLEITAADVAYESRSFQAAELDRIAAGTSQLQGAGMLKVLAFQFGGARLLPDGVSLSSSRVLKPRQALLLTQQVMTFSGKRDSVRVRVQSSGITSEGVLRIAAETSRTAFSLPLKGTWHDGAGPSMHSHHRWVVPQEFAHDFTRIGSDGLAYRGEGTRFSDYYAYGEPVFAAAAGQVAEVLEDEPEDVTLLQRAGEPLDAYVNRIVERQNEQLTKGARGIVGNHVLIRHGSEYSLYAHLKPGSVRVKVGDTVTKGQQIASVGSSGSSTEPHLHFHVCDAPDVLMCSGIPVRFEDVEIYGALHSRQLQSGDLVRNRMGD